MFLQTERLADLSVQEMVDCSHENYGCRGGWPGIAFEYVERTGGLLEEQEYRQYGATVRVMLYTVRVRFVRLKCIPTPNGEDWRTRRAGLSSVRCLGKSDVICLLGL